jgi:hypothetical protein
MSAQLAELLYWMACWIAVTVAMMALAAWTLGGEQAWLSVIAYFGTAGCVWLIGRVVLLGATLGRRKRLPD